MDIDIFTGEKFQNICSVYISSYEALQYNPHILIQKEKHLLFKDIPEIYNNPKHIFTHTHTIEELIRHLYKFQNPFILLTHNSDYNITEKYIDLLNNSKLIHMYSQNPCIIHPKLSMLPIGIANKQWPHGNISLIEQHKFNKNKQYRIYFNFKLHTNYNRNICKESLAAKGVPFIPDLPFNLYIQILSLHKFSICPEGNGVDSHRIWESLNCGTIPILLRTTFTEYIEKVYPCILLDSWEDFSYDSIINTYLDDPFTDEIKHKLSFNYYKDMILNH